LFIVQGARPASGSASSSTPKTTENPKDQTSGNPLIDERTRSEQQALRALQQASESQQESTADNPFGLSAEEQEIVDELRETDRKVRDHEQAHKSAAGPYAGAVQYETTTGPDGREYAVSGNVSIDASPVPNNPEATIRKMNVVERAALAPAQPSSEDFAVARQAQQTRLQAQEELRKQEQAEQQDGGSESGGANANPALTAQAIENLLKAEQLGREAISSFQSAA